MDLVKQIGKALPAGIGTAIFTPIKIIFDAILAFLKLPFLKFFTGIVDLLTNIPAFFKPISDTINGLCKIVSGILNKILNIILGPALVVYKAAKKAYDAMMAVLISLVHLVVMIILDYKNYYIKINMNYLL